MRSSSIRVTAGEQALQRPAVRALGSTALGSRKGRVEAGDEEPDEVACSRRVARERLLDVSL